MIESYLDLCLAPQLEFVAQIELVQDLHGALVDVDPVGWSNEIIIR